MGYFCVTLGGKILTYVEYAAVLPPAKALNYPHYTPSCCLARSNGVFLRYSCLQNPHIRIVCCGFAVFEQLQNSSCYTLFCE